jgi:DNA mismatch repair protein MutS
MKVFLLYPDRDFDLSRELPPNAADLSQDLGLDIVFAAMAQGDQFLLDVARRVVLSGSDELDVILYRQEILRDCLKHPDIVRQIYSIPVEFLERKRKEWLWISPRHAGPSSILSGAQRMLEVSLDLLQKLRQIADEHAGAFTSRGLPPVFLYDQAGAGRCVSSYGGQAYPGAALPQRRLAERAAGQWQ